MNPYIIIGISLFVLMIIIVVLFMPLGLGIKYENGAFLIVKVSVFSFNISFEKIVDRFLNKPKEKKETDIEKEIDKSIVDVDFIISLFGNFRRFVRKRFNLTKFDLDVEIGTAEAASTAVLTGMLYGFAYNLLALIDQLVLVKDPKVNVKPQFNDAVFALTLRGIITARLVHIIATAIVFAYKLLKYKINKTRRKIK